MKIILACSTCPCSKEVDNDEPVRGVPPGMYLMQWWYSVAQQCKHCRKGLPPCPNAYVSVSPPGPMTPAWEVRAWVLSHLDVGIECPSCTNHTQVQPRVLNSGMARALIVIYRSFGRNFDDLPALLKAHRRHRPLQHPQGGEEAKLRYWGLLEEDPTRRAYYRVTGAGEEWVLGRTIVPKHALVMTTGGRCVGLSGPPWTIHDALGTKFNLAQLLSAPPFTVPAAALPPHQSPPSPPSPPSPTTP